MEKNKIKNVSKNMILAVLSNVVALLLTFIVRKVFILKLGSEFVGLNSLFINILGILSFAELGIGVAVTSSLYKPLQEGNIPLLKAYLGFYKKFMNGVAVFIEIAGAVVGFFIPMMIHGNSRFSVFELWLYFFLYTSASAASYVLTYKRVLLTADQSEYLNSINNLLFKVVIAVFQIIVLLIWNSYILYLMIQIILTLVSNIVISRKINRLYGSIFDKGPVAKLKDNYLLNLKKDITGMISAKIGGIILTSTDNIIISAFLGLTILGKYANYTMIITGLTLVLNQIFYSLTPTIGNYRFTSLKRSENEELDVFNRISIINYAIVILASTGAILFSAFFVKIWLGQKFILPYSLVITLVLSFAINQYRQVVIIYMSAYGLFWQQRYKSLLEALMNIALSIILITTTQLGIFAVLIGTIATNLFFNLIWEFIIVKNHAILLLNSKSYFIKYFGAFVILVVLVFSNTFLAIFYQKYFSDLMNFVLLCMSFASEVLVSYFVVQNVFKINIFRRYN
ncbi:lipopolysaccharide biosynthesis protein [Leuconostoc holzapfelii]|nr:oligosaccharide flippase family protein [Leuconostoc holzapfelii]